MSTTILDARSVLENAQYRTYFPKPDAQHIYFEDSSIRGVLHVLENVEAIVTQWEHLQDNFLKINGSKLSTSPHKAWNCYTVFLTAQPAPKTQCGQLFAIEENFRSTRKLARAGVKTKADMEVALGPLLPLRRLLSLQSDDVNAMLESRLGGAETPLAGIVAKADPNQIAAALIASQ